MNFHVGFWMAHFANLLSCRRRQRRLSGQVEELETNITDLLATPLTDDDVDDYDLTTLRIEGEAELGAALPSLSSYSLFNSAPYGNLGKNQIMCLCMDNLVGIQGRNHP